MDEKMEEALHRVIEETVALDAGKVDEGEFPRRAVDALGQAGLLGLTVGTDAGGGGGGLRDAVSVIRSLSGVCGSTAMVTLMHYAATAVIEQHGPLAVWQEIAAGDHLTPLAFSEVGSRSHFWASLGTSSGSGDAVRLDAKKSWVTSAAQAVSYVWSSRPLRGDGPLSLWLVPASTSGLSVAGAFDGFGLRGNGSTPVTAEAVKVPSSAALGADGAGLDIALADALPTFLVLSAAFSVGLMEAVVEETGHHLRATRLEHLTRPWPTRRSCAPTTPACASPPIRRPLCSATPSTRSRWAGPTAYSGSSR